MLGIFLGLQTIILMLKCWGGQAKKQKKKNVSNTIIQLCVVSFLSNFCLFLLCCFLLFSLVPVFMFLPLLINLSCDACKPPFQFRRTQTKHWFQSQSRVIYMFQMSFCVIWYSIFQNKVTCQVVNLWCWSFSAAALFFLHLMDEDKDGEVPLVTNKYLSEYEIWVEQSMLLV